MSRFDQRYLGSGGFPQTLTGAEIERFFTPTPEEKLAILQRRSVPNRIAFALQIGFLKMTGRSLNSVELAPAAILSHIGAVIGCTPPRIASIRALYRRRRTLFDHQSQARQLLGRREISDHGMRGLTGYLRREAISVYDVADLSGRARGWLVDHGYLLPRDRQVRRLVVKTLRHQERVLFDAVCAVVDTSVRQAWPERLLEVAPDGKASLLDWLQTPPDSHRVRVLDEQLVKLDLLKELGADRLTEDVLPLVGLERFHARVVSRRPAMLRTIRDPHRTLELACFLRLERLRQTDIALDLIDQQIATQWREARAIAQERQQGKLQRFRGLVGELTVLADADGLSAEALREKLRGLVMPFRSELDNTQVLSIRKELATRSRELTRLLKAARRVDLDMPDDHQLSKALAILDQTPTQTQLPPSCDNPFGRSWSPLIEQKDRAAALSSYTAATAMLLKRALKNRSVMAKHSLTHRSTESRLIPPALWNRDRGRYLRDLSLPKTAIAYLDRLKQALAAAVSRLDQAARDGLVTINKDGVHVPRRKPQAKDPALDRARKALSSSFGSIQLSDVMIEVDGHARFSALLLGRPAKSEDELVMLYVALMALGSDLTAAALARMVPGIDTDALDIMIQRIASFSRLRSANDAVAAFMRRHRVTRLWGQGLYASADMMSLDASRHLWNARLDPRRKGPAIGTYPHVLDQWSIFYDQPIVLGRRQAGAAIEGMLRQTVVEKVERVAVDTHGFSYFGVSVGKFCGFDICPRLAHVRTRKLFLPRGFNVPLSETIKLIVSSETVAPQTIIRGWDGFVRLSASIHDGWYPATSALDQFGSVSEGDPVYATGVAIGKLLRSIYLCDYFANPEFRNGILDLLNQGEAVHSLQRAIHPGPIGPRHGRSPEQMRAISSALTLLTNIVMAWNTHHTQRAMDQNPDAFPDNLVAQIAPIRHAHINMRGVIAFDTRKLAKGLITPDGDIQTRQFKTKPETT